MRSSAIFPLVSAFLCSRVLALPYSVPCPSDDDQDNPNQRPVTKTLTDGYLTGVPSPTSTGEGYITGVPAPWSTTDGYITGVPEPTSTEDGYTSVVTDPSSTCTDDNLETSTSIFSSGTEYITGVPSPSSTGGQWSNITSIPVFSSSSTLTESETSAIPTPTKSSSCRPTTWSREGQAPSVGKLRAALIFVDFPDAPSIVTPDILYQEFSSKPAELYRQMSYDKLELEIVPLLDQFYRMPADSSSYNYSRALTTEMHLKYIEDAVTAAGAAITFADIDALYIMTNTEAKEISFSTSTKATIKAADNTTISNSITYGQDLYFSWGYKTVNHETGHAMGLPDLYPYAPGGEVPQWVGGYDLMGLIGGQSPDFFAWHKWQLDWVDDSQVDCIDAAGTTTHTLSPIEIAGATSPTKAIAVPINSTAYVMVEVRSTFGIDEEACGTGVLVYTADSAVGSGDGPIRVIDSKTSSSNHGCTVDKGGELNDAPLKAGEEMDTGLGVSVKVLSMDGEDYVVEIEKTI